MTDRRRKLTPRRVARIRVLHPLGVTPGELAAMYGVTRRAIRKVVRGLTWKN